MLRPAVYGGSPNPVEGGVQQPVFDIERMQVIALPRAVVLRVTTRGIPLNPFQMGIVRECRQWRIDGITPLLSLYNLDTAVRRNHINGEIQFLVTLSVDFRFPMNNPIDISLNPYTEPVTTADPGERRISIEMLANPYAPVPPLPQAEPPREPEVEEREVEVETILPSFDNLDTESEL